MVGKFVIGILSGGALVTGGFVLGSALFPLTPVAPANAPAATVETAAADPAPAVTEPQAEAPEPEPAPEPTPEPLAEPEPAPEPTAVETPKPAEPTVDAPPAETAVAPAPAETTEVATAAADATLPQAEAVGEAVTETTPMAEPAAEAEDIAVAEAPAPALEAEPAPAATEVVEAPQAEPAATDAPAAPVAEVATPVVPLAPVTLPQLDTDAVLAALDDSAVAPAATEGASAAEAAPVVAEVVPKPAPDVVAEVVPEAAPAVTDPTIELAEATPEPTPLPEPTPVPEATPAPEPVPEPEPVEVIPEPVPEPAPAVDPAPEAAPVTEPVPEVAPVEEPVTDAMPAPTTDDSDAGRLPGIVARDMPGSKPDSLPGTDAAPEDTDVAILPEPEAPATEGDGGAAFKPAPGLADAAEGVIVGRLPRIGDTADAAPEAAVEGAPADARPIAQFAVPFENPEAKPVLAIVLIDSGAADLDRAALAALPFPVSFALDPMDPATPERSALYRAAGKEVVMLATGIADGAQASDIEVAFQSMAQGLPEAVAVMDLAEPVFQNRRPLASLVVPVVGAQGRGLVTWDQGLNAADQVARREDIAAAVIFRDLASAGADADAIRRVLDRAVFKAGQDGRVALAGLAAPETVNTLLEWAIEGRAATVAIAPLTAVMTVD